MPDIKKTKFFGGMVGIIKSIRKRIGENRCGFLKRNFMFRKITNRFLLVPIKQHNRNITANGSFS